MEIKIHTTFLPHDDADASLAFYRDTLGFEVRNQVEQGGMHWNTVGPPGQPDVNLVLHSAGADPGVTDAERQTIAEMMAKGTYASLMLSSPDLDAVFEHASSRGADIVQEPTDQPWGQRDCALRDPAGNMIRIQQS
jgi:uncharacterized glyoxalase superfamily protein PhnB